jgi:hypothetical protein
VERRVDLSRGKGWKMRDRLWAAILCISIWPQARCIKYVKAQKNGLEREIPTVHLGEGDGGDTACRRCRARVYAFYVP